MTGRPLTCWVVSDGKAGMENQCLGLAEAVGIEPVVKRVALRAPWRQLTPFLRLGLAHAADPARGDPVAPPWPDLLIASGRQSTAPALLARRASGGRTFTVYIQNPVVSPKLFDLVVVPRHDRLRGANVLSTRGALHRVTPARLAEAAGRAAARLGALPRPRLAVLIGGNNGVYTLTADRMREIAGQLAGLARQGIGLMVTPSRRTGPENEAILRGALAGTGAEVWDFQGENPYFAYLGSADAIAVTCDSVSMVSEAASTGKPVYVIGLPGGGGKFDAFHKAMAADGITRPFDGGFASWSYAPLDDTPRIAAAVRERMAARGLTV
ncbi:MAG TPA: mitochondrial fission ELM1 family protein [Alphaproteobacteria bacterium]|nr:mitochondrial fission ELM1 family protein [Alphaproteobacteria bacterium]